MTPLTLTITGRIPSKKNSRQIHRIGGRIIVSTSPEYKAWHEEQTWKLKGVKPVEQYPVRVTIQFWMPDAIRADLTNKAESIMDLLVDCGVLRDDNWNVVPEVLLMCAGIDRQNPRAEIEIG